MALETLPGLLVTSRELLVTAPLEPPKADTAPEDEDARPLEPPEADTAPLVGTGPDVDAPDEDPAAPLDDELDVDSAAQVPSLVHAYPSLQSDEFLHSFLLPVHATPETITHTRNLRMTARPLPLDTDSSAADLA